MDTLSFCGTLFAMSSAVVVLAEYATKITKAEGKWAQFQSWVIAIAIGICGSWLNFGVFEGTDWKAGLVLGIISGLVANGIFDMGFIKTILSGIGARSSELKKY